MLTDEASGPVAADREVAGYLARVLVQLHHRGIPVDRAVLRPGRAGAMVVLDPPAGAGPVPAAAGWDRASGWSTRAGSPPAVHRLPGRQPEPSAVAEFLAGLAGADASVELREVRARPRDGGTR